MDLDDGTFSLYKNMVITLLDYDGGGTGWETSANVSTSASRSLDWICALGSHSYWPFICAVLGTNQS